MGLSKSSSKTVSEIRSERARAVAEGTIKRPSYPEDAARPSSVRSASNRSSSQSSPHKSSESSVKTSAEEDQSNLKKSQGRPSFTVTVTDGEGHAGTLRQSKEEEQAEERERRRAKRMQELKEQEFADGEPWARDRAGSERLKKAKKVENPSSEQAVGLEVGAIF